VKPYKGFRCDGFTFTVTFFLHLFFLLLVVAVVVVGIPGNPVEFAAFAIAFMLCCN